MTDKAREEEGGSKVVEAGCFQGRLDRRAEIRAKVDWCEARKEGRIEARGPLVVRQEVQDGVPDEAML